jgi:AcrR family transcriptional regulator
MADPRTERTQAALALAIAKIAAEQPARSITVSKIAAEAGINRATFYNYFESPSDLLAQVLSADLDRISVTDAEVAASRGLSPTQKIRLSIESVADHVERFEGIYRLAASDPTDNVSAGVLADHFTQWSLIAGGVEASTPAAVPAELILTARFLGHGLVGAVEAWLTTPGVTRDDLVATVLDLLPA